MASQTFSQPVAPGPVKTVKVVIAGGFAAGKTTFVKAVSDIRPFTTEAPITEASIGIDDAGVVSDRKTTTTVAMDFGRAPLNDNLWLYLFGTPGQERFKFMWNQLSVGALGAIVLLDTRRLEDSFMAVDYFESKGLPFVVAINCFDGIPTHSTEDVRNALDVPGDVPVMLIDARQKDHAKAALTELVKHGLARAQATQAAATG
ncbi:GTP-binding protein [Euzebya pacifica]|uniref:GTP-binding protein n=1 Tax=Euzebya pacifica TaxID=1608957 RepID=UPI000DF7C5F9|nr:ATP/GTP-binding protein [Euzebya pacifica]